MQLKRIVGSVTAVVALTAAVVLYAVHPAKSSDHQDTYNLANAVGHNTSADITDVYVFPSPSNPNNVVFAMDVSPLIPAGGGTSKFFDPTLMWQFKIAHGATNFQEDQVIQFKATGTDANQTITVYGPAAPAQVGTANTFITATGTAKYNTVTPLTVAANQYQVYAGPRADPFVFDLFAFFSFLGDRDFQTHSAQNDAGPGTLYNADSTGLAGQVSTPQDKAQLATNPSFAGFAAGSTSGAGAALGNYACNTGPSQNALAGLAGGFNVLSFVIEVPKSVIYGSGTAFPSSVIHVWATASSATTNS